ncbi:hypothetical protein OG474_19965 [Kribbella sp. NBC_01505]|uniref:hypothetical protein n=1 Tax=Kribbella sp. NBC_01505 TaxID=2903580 RepID=UPI00386539F3
MARNSAAAAVTIHVHMDEHTALRKKLFTSPGGSPWMTLDIGDGLETISLFVRDLTVLDGLGDMVEQARKELAGELGLLPNGEPCRFVDVLGSLEWNEHDHDQCLEQLIDEPVPFVPVVVSSPGTAWERHDDPTVEDNPLDDDDYGDDQEEDNVPADCRPGSRVLYAEGWL